MNVSRSCIQQSEAYPALRCADINGRITPALSRGTPYAHPAGTFSELVGLWEEKFRHGFEDFEMPHGSSYINWTSEAFDGDAEPSRTASNS